MFKGKRSKFSLRKIIGAIFISKIIIVLIHVIHAVTLDRVIQYKEVPFYSERIPEEMKGYRIAFIVDTHNISEVRLQEVVRRLNDEELDLLILGGDFSRGEGEPARSIEILSQVVATDGIYGVEGNHDRFRELFAAMEEHNMHPLSNSGAYIRENFYLAGVEDIWRRAPDIAEATAGAGEDSFVILVSHSPDVSMEQDTRNVDLILSGHTHGGQITFFGLWAPALAIDWVTSYGHRFMSGWAESRDGTPVYVSNGTAGYYPRVFARPQVILFTLYPE